MTNKIQKDMHKNIEKGLNKVTAGHKTDKVVKARLSKIDSTKEWLPLDSFGNVRKEIF